ncbi:cobyrinate a,c-diamide synthase [Pigmentiphaga aceris]|uniref:Cobyrinate a,c-diamide synthase n=1 Tax=Pigmentiphaga aceris TaxID=1940612 RepID=A0A5C0B6C9_9BURK|nr:cobyrinate a,c-diamide synthase [Pigmentiphaga aceris]QEI08970.1 cobyrinate a,c-diamide synthase [Pigmentiphaga aceris]
MSLTRPASTCRAVLISAIASGQGKTTVTAALARRLVREGKRVRVFKTGPDFLDPMLLARASGAPVHPLDLWMVGVEASRQRLADAARDADVILVEGVMGLYDGKPSSADLARAFGLPVLLVVDASAMAQTVGAVVCGLRDYGPCKVLGVIANRVASSGHATMVAESLRDVALVATLPRQTASLPERHLGLVQADEVADLDALLDTLADALVLRDGVDNWPLLQFDAAEDRHSNQHSALLTGKTIAIARDAAFAFVYPANIDCLHALGADIVFFSPLADDAIPANADAVYLPGGYPELHAETLADAHAWRASIREADAAGMPILAECGGMMALADMLVDAQGVSWPMAGVLTGTVRMQTKLAGLGMQSLPTAHGHVRGHTFHYSRFDTSLVPHAHTTRQRDGSAGEAVYLRGALHASYFHAYFPSQPHAIAALLGADLTMPMTMTTHAMPDAITNHKANP